jgi:hypothetical protein
MEGEHMHYECLDCGDPIGARRLEILPTTEYCVKCADKHTPVMGGFMLWTHKTAPEFVLMDSEKKAADTEYRFGRRRAGAQVAIGSTAAVRGLDFDGENPRTKK